MKGPKKVYVCSECDYQSQKWLGRCPSCQSWNTFVEETYSAPAPVAKEERGIASLGDGEGAVSFSEAEIPTYQRSSTGIEELDRVLGGGLVRGSVILLAGEPGIGKSTLLMQICGNMEERILYVSGEESKGQLKLRAKRLGMPGEDVMVMTETNVDAILHETEKIDPELLIIDSVQTMYSSGVNSIPGSVGQVKECAMKYIGFAKSCGISVILVGHVNKEGAIAGPKVLEHMVDAVLHFEGERRQTYRIIRAVKNRFGSTNEIGVFEMNDTGLHQVENPSEMLLDGRPKDVPGNCAVCVMEGTRPIIAEIQALVSPTTFPAPRRTSNGVDYNRMCLLLAVLEKRLGLRFSTCDVYLNVIGGLKLDEPAADLAIALALISGLKDIVIPDHVIAFGEIGLAGECRAVTSADLRVKEAVRLGFTEIALPNRCLSENMPKLPTGASYKSIKGIFDALSLLRQANKNE
ncbi:MAG: DNA repair protein RadA [Clostridia bacterium]|nr:DNA repair protein RadA [Clostridia bacterium]